MTLPQPEVQTFSGGPTMHHTFISRTACYADNSYYLNQYLEFLVVNIGTQHLDSQKVDAC